MGEDYDSGFYLAGSGRSHFGQLPNFFQLGFMVERGWLTATVCSWWGYDLAFLPRCWQISLQSQQNFSLPIFSILSVMLYPGIVVSSSCDGEQS